MPPSSHRSDKKRKSKHRGSSQDLEGKVVETFLNGRKEEEVILAYPFGDPELVEVAAEGLPRCSRLVPEAASGETNTEDNESSADDDEATSEEADVRPNERYKTIIAKDIKRLCAETWLNDSLIDFWMKW